MKDLIEENELEAEESWEDLSPIQKFYYGKNILITGATGVIGKTLLEKVIRCCPEIGKIYVLMRPKKGLTVEERLDKILNSELFDIAKKKRPNLKKNITIIYADMLEPNLGMSESDLAELIANVQFVFHSAASVRFDDPIKSAVQSNVIGLIRIIELLKKFEKLEHFIHVSTTFTHREPDFTIPEHVTRMNVTPQQVIGTLEWLDEEALKQISPSLLKEKSNTYLFSKSLAENVILDEYESIPVSIVRSGVAAPLYRGPIAGYCDTIQGPQGVFIAAAKGFLRTLYTFPNVKLNVIPTDAVVNTILATAWYAKTYKPDGLFVVNCALDQDKLLVMDEELLARVMVKRDEYPLANFYRYPDFTMYYTPFFYYIHAFFDHYIPAIIGDTLLFIFTGKPIMLSLYRKINFLFGEFVKMGKDPWIFLKDNYDLVMNHLSEKDSKIFYMNMDDIDYDLYMDNVLLCGRRIITKEDPSNIPYARKKAKVWWFVTTVLKWCFILYAANLILSYIFPDNPISSYISGSQTALEYGAEF